VELEVLYIIFQNWFTPVLGVSLVGTWANILKNTNKLMIILMGHAQEGGFDFMRVPFA
jgi:hypothetical protein